MFLAPVFILIPLALSLASADDCFSVVNNSIPCVKLCFHDKMMLTFNNSNMTVPNNASVDGICSKFANEKQNFSQLELTWIDGSGRSDWLGFYFLINIRSTGEGQIGAKHNWYLSNITYTSNSSNSNRTYTSLGSYLSILASDVFSYECETFTANLTRDAATDNYVVLRMWNYRVQAFVLTESGNFSDPDHCLGPGYPYYVPLSVGCALIVLVLIPFVVRLVYYSFHRCNDCETKYTLLEPDVY